MADHTTIGAVIKQRDEALARLTAAETRVAELKAGLGALVRKLDDLEQPVNDLTFFAHNHGFPWTGPNYAEELRRARSLIQEGSK